MLRASISQAAVLPPPSLSVDEELNDRTARVAVLPLPLLLLLHLLLRAPWLQRDPWVRHCGKSYPTPTFIDQLGCGTAKGRMWLLLTTLECASAGDKQLLEHVKKLFVNFSCVAVGIKYILSACLQVQYIYGKDKCSELLRKICISVPPLKFSTASLSKKAR